MDVEQQITKSYEGLVKVEFFTADEDIKWQEKAEKAALREIIQARNDGFDLNDILILTRKTAEASRIARYLLDNGISALSEEALLVTSSPKVQLIISTLKYLKNNEDQLAIAEFNHFYNNIFGIKPDEFTSNPSYLNTLNRLITRPVYEIIEEIVIKLEIPDEGDIYLQQLFDICFLQTKKGNATLLLFINWWQEELANSNSKEMTIALPGGEEAIKVMTIHKAKGLEFPIVMMPYTDSSMAPKAGSIFWAIPLPKIYNNWGSLPLGFANNLAKTKFSEVYYEEYFKNSLEALNLLYVAFTRAVERLYLFSNSKSNGTSSGGLIFSIFDSLDFKFSNYYNKEAQTFTLGEAQPKESSKSKEVITSEHLKASNSALSNKLAIDQGKSRLFLSYSSEKSNKVKEGIALHKAMSMIENKQSVGPVLKKLESEQIISSELAISLKAKIILLFDKIPQLNDWFGDKYEVLNERKILAKGDVLIPDRVMIKDKKAIVIDYKREQKDPKHHKQIKNYGELLLRMGYQNVEMYLIYIDDHSLVEVK
jgi:ATP-dependent exoDNAse (exonuclease V) beta subunit